MSTSAPDRLEEQLRAVLATIAESTPVDDRAFDGQRHGASLAARTRSPRRVLLVAAIGLAAALLVGALVVRAGDDRRLHTAATIDVADDPLGPLPHYLIGDRPWTVVSASVGPLPIPESDPGWWVQVFADADRSTTVELLSAPDDPGRVRALEENISGAGSGAHDVQVQGSPARLRQLGVSAQLWWNPPGGQPVWMTVRGVADDAAVLAIADALVPRADRRGWDAPHLPDGVKPWVDGAREDVTASEPQWRFEGWAPGSPWNVLLTVSHSQPLTTAETLANLSGEVEPLHVLGHPGWLEVSHEVDGQVAGVRVIWLPGPNLVASLGLGTREQALQVLSQLREVSAAEWTAALPADALVRGQQEALFGELAPGTPLPEGVTLAGLAGTSNATSRQAATLTVVSRWNLMFDLAVASQCAWARRWAQATEAGDTAGADAAEATLAGAADWSVVQRYDELSPDPDHYEQPYAGSNGFDNYLDLVHRGDVGSAMRQTEICAVS